MALKNHLLTVLSIAIMATSIAEAQQLGTIGISINGTVPCGLGSNGTPPPFPNATVVLLCPLNVIRANTTTSSSGTFNLTLTVTPFNISNLLNCKVVVTTPLNKCNPTLPGTGQLASISLIAVGINFVNGVLTLFLEVLGFIFVGAAISN